MAPHGMKPIKKRTKNWDLSAIEIELSKYTEGDVPSDPELQEKVNSLNSKLNSTINKLDDVTDVLISIVEGDEAVQRKLIQVDPFYIQHIPNPYVSIQLEAIAANPKCFDFIKHPSQEAIDTYRIIK